MQEQSADVIDLGEYRRKKECLDGYNRMREYLLNHFEVPQEFLDRFYPGYMIVDVELVKDNDEPGR